MNTEKQIDFPPLPKPAAVSVTDTNPGAVWLRDSYSAAQMRDYAAADRAQRPAEPVAWMDFMGNVHLHWKDALMGDSEPQPLYTAPPAQVSDGYKLVPKGDLQELHDSIHGDCYMGEEWEKKAVSAMLLDAPPPAQVPLTEGQKKKIWLDAAAAHPRSVVDAGLAYFAAIDTAPPAGQEAFAYEWQYTAPPSAQVPEGWRLVPLEPTEEMIQAGCLSQQATPEYDNYDAWCDSHSGGIIERIRGYLQKDYRAMLAAAPDHSA